MVLAMPLAGLDNDLRGGELRAGWLCSRGYELSFMVPAKIPRMHPRSQCRVAGQERGACRSVV